jgi:isocitrate/isopropylmalate dehydrogenase
LIKLQRSLDLFVNLRPVRPLDGAPSHLVGRKLGDIDYTAMRENTEGIRQCQTTRIRRYEGRVHHAAGDLFPEGRRIGTASFDYRSATLNLTNAEELQWSNSTTC